MKKCVCNYSVVRFVPDQYVGEFVNVGVITVEPKENIFTFKLELEKFDRAMSFFRGIDEEILVKSVNKLNEELLFLDNDVKNKKMSALHAFKLIVRPIEAMIRFSDERIKLSGDAVKTNEELFKELVAV